MCVCCDVYDIRALEVASQWSTKPPGASQSNIFNAIMASWTGSKDNLLKGLINGSSHRDKRVSNSIEMM